MDASAIRPLREHVLVRLEPEPEGAILVAAGWRKPPTRGVVLAVGDGKPVGAGDRRPMSVRPGDVVLWNDAGVGERVTLPGGAEGMVVSEDNLLGVEEA